MCAIEATAPVSARHSCRRTCADTTPAAEAEAEAKQPGLHRLSVPPAILKRGFWIYVWRVGLPAGGHTHYVGMTGDTGAARAQSTANHVAAHLGFSINASALRKALRRQRQTRFEDCLSLEFFAFGPAYPQPEAADYAATRGKVAVLAKHLWLRMEAFGYDMLNAPPNATMPLDGERWSDVCAAFQQHFTKLR